LVLSSLHQISLSVLPNSGPGYRTLTTTTAKSPQRLLAVGRGGAGPLAKNWFQENEIGYEQKNAFSR
jgi:hypothetical protein